VNLVFSLAIVGAGVAELDKRQASRTISDGFLKQGREIGEVEWSSSG
jgi:hypothetical protein